MQHHIGRHAEIDQTGNFIDANRLQTFNQRKAILWRTDQCAVCEITIRCAFKQRLKIIIGQVVHVESTLGSHRRYQFRGLPQIGLERLAREMRLRFGHCHVSEAIG